MTKNLTTTQIATGNARSTHKATYGSPQLNTVNCVYNKYSYVPDHYRIDYTSSSSSSLLISHCQTDDFADVYGEAQENKI